MDPMIRYRENVTNKIEKLKQQLHLWSKRHISLIGRSLIVKTFAMSQLVFASQFCNISNYDIKKIERICYLFINGSKTERIKRSTLKCPKMDGGINAIDVDCFLKSVKIRQYLKALGKSPILSYIQNCQQIKEDIKNIVRKTLKNLLKTNYNNIDLDSVSAAEKELLANTDLRYILNSGSKGETFLRDIDAYNIANINDLVLSKRQNNKLNKLIPANLIPLLLEDFQYQDLVIAIALHKGNQQSVVNISKLSSLELQLILKGLYKKILVPNIYHSHKVVNDYHANETNWKGLWNIKHPTLKALRYRFMHRDVYSLERLSRYGITESSRCVNCGNVETVRHLFFDCWVAARMWRNIATLCGIKLNSYEDLLVISQDSLIETIISVGIKCIIQIDRKKVDNVNYFKSLCSFYLTLECNLNNEKRISELKKKVQNLTYSI